MKKKSFITSPSLLARPVETRYPMVAAHPILYRPGTYVGVVYIPGYTTLGNYSETYWEFLQLKGKYLCAGSRLTTAENLSVNWGIGTGDSKFRFECFNKNPLGVDPFTSQKEAKDAMVERLRLAGYTGPIRRLRL